MITIDEPALEGHSRVNLLELILAIEGKAAAATGGDWHAPDDRAGGVALSAIVTGAPTDPVAESMTVEDQQHVIAMQPLVTGALCRKLREAFYLLQDSAKMNLVLYHTLVELLGPSAVSERMDALSARMAVFPIIQVPDGVVR